MSPHGQGLSRARGAAGRAGLSTDTLVAAMARQGPAGGVAWWGQRGALPSKSRHQPTHRGSSLPSPPGSSVGLVLGRRPHLRGRRGAQHIPPQQRQHLFIAAPVPPRHGHRSEVINAETRGVNWAPTPWQGLLSPGAVPCGGSGVRGGGTGPGTDAGIAPRGRRRDNAALCGRYHRGWEAGPGKQGGCGMA